MKQKLMSWVWEFVVKNNLENKMHRINDQGIIVDERGVPIKDHKGKEILVPLEYRYHYQEYKSEDE